MKFRWEKKYLYWGITAFFVIVCAISFFIWLNNFKAFMEAIKFLGQILMPFFMGAAFAYLMNPVMSYVENKMMIPICCYCREHKGKAFFSDMKLPRPPKGRAQRKQWRDERRQAAQIRAAGRKSSKLTRTLSILIALLFAIAVIAALLVMVIPQLVQSIIGLANNLPEYLRNAENAIINLVEANPGVKEVLSDSLADMNKNIIDWAKNNMLPQLSSALSGITIGVLGFVNVLKNLLIGIIISVYILFSKEKFAAQCKKLIYGLFPIRAANIVLQTSRRADKVFGGFVIGKIIDSAIIGVLCFLGMNLFNLISPRDMPFVVLISVIVGVTNVIPFFGPFIGAIPSGILILLVDPLVAVYFGIFILLLQQLDGNIIGPKILGDSTGLSAFWVMFAILLGGGLFGFAGMLLGVPAFAVLYNIIVEILNSRLKKRELPVSTDEYASLHHIDPVDEIPIDEADAPIRILEEE